MNDKTHRKTYEKSMKYLDEIVTYMYSNRQLQHAGYLLPQINSTTKSMVKEFANETYE